MSLTRDQILAAQDCKTVEVQVKEWGGSVFVRMLNGQEREDLDSAILGASKAGDVMKGGRARMACAFACDAEGNRIFTMADITAVMGKSAVMLERIVKAGMKLNAMRERDVEELEKNS